MGVGIVKAGENRMSAAVNDCVGRLFQLRGNSGKTAVFNKNVANLIIMGDVLIKIDIMKS